MRRSESCLKKVERVNKALHHQEADRVPISDFFWGSFLERWRKDLNLSPDTDIYKYYDLDWTVTIPNMDPHIKEFEIIKRDDEEIIVRTGFEAHVEKKYKYPMPAYIKFATDTVEKMEAFRFDDPWDKRRYLSGGANQVAGIGDGFVQNLPPWIETVKSLYPEFPVYGSICEAHEELWRIIGTENVMMWIGLYPKELTKFIKRIGEFLVEVTKAQIKYGDGALEGLVIWGDVAYTKDLFFSPDFWRENFKPIVKNLIDVTHGAGINVIYHGCGNVRKILPDFIEIGIDAYNPLEYKAGMDAVELRRQYGHKLGMCGNMDVMLWADGSKEKIKEAVLTKLNAAKGGGFIFQSDHSVPSNVSGQNYDYVVKLVRKYGKYPLKLGKYDLSDIK